MVDVEKRLLATLDVDDVLGLVVMLVAEVVGGREGAGRVEAVLYFGDVIPGGGTRLSEGEANFTAAI